MSDLADKLTQAIDKKNNDINSWVWRTSGDKNVRMMDMTPEQLQRAYSHVDQMLNNQDPYHPGVQRKRDQVRKMWDCANTELLLRHIIYDCNIEGLRTNKDLLDFISAHKKANNISNSDSISTIFNGLSEGYSRITIDSLLSACLDTLPAFNKKLLSDKFILSLGIWLTDQEMKDLTEYDENGKVRDRKTVIKERLLLNPAVEIHFNSRGLTFNEFRMITQIDGRPKFSMLSTSVITLLRDKLLLVLDQDLEYHIQKWSNLKEHLELISEQKGITLK